MTADEEQRPTVQSRVPGRTVVAAPLDAIPHGGGAAAWASDVGTAGSHSDWRERLAASPVPRPAAADPTLREIASRLWGGESLSLEDGIRLFAHPDLPGIAAMAHAVKRARFDHDVHFNHNMHVNQTNICTLACRFCAFRRGPRADDAYALDLEAYLDVLGPHAAEIDEVHSVGGLHPEWDVATYETLFRGIHAAHPHLHIKALTAVEVKHVADLSGLSVRDLLIRLKAAGLGSLPGGGAEILVDRVRDLICRGKETSQEYLDIHRTAHEIGLPTNATMLFGTVETPEERVRHLILLRELQAETGGFQCFVPYPFLADNTRLPEAQLATAAEILRTIAISRLVLDTIPHLKAYRMNLGDRVAVMALMHGANDLDGTVQRESIMHEAGATSPLDSDRAELAALIEAAGGRPVQRNTIYTRFRRFQPPPPGTDRPLPLANLTVGTSA